MLSPSHSESGFEKLKQQLHAFQIIMLTISNLWEFTHGSQIMASCQTKPACHNRSMSIHYFIRQGGQEGPGCGAREQGFNSVLLMTGGGRFWWTKSPPKSAQKSTRESRYTKKRALESKCTRLSAQKSAQTSSTAQTRAQRIALKSKSLIRVLKRVRYSIKCSGEWVNQKNKLLKRVRYS